MPNWCENEVIITGDAEELRELITEGAKTPSDYESEHEVKFLMDNLVPMPKELLEDGGDWYNWRLNNWGCKWDLNQEYDDTRVYYEDGDTEASMGYSTPWAPNRDFWVAVSKRFPSLTIDLSYVEEGMFFMGQEIIKAGNTVNEVYHNDIPNELVVQAGGVFGKDGEIDWEGSDINFWDCFPLIKQEELV